jgi:hypothetical protein
VNKFPSYAAMPKLKCIHCNSWFYPTVGGRKLSDAVKDALQDRFGAVSDLQYGECDGCRRKASKDLRLQDQTNMAGKVFHY